MAKSAANVEAHERGIDEKKMAATEEMDPQVTDFVILLASWISVLNPFPTTSKR